MLLLTYICSHQNQTFSIQIWTFCWLWKDPSTFFGRFSFTICFVWTLLLSCWYLNAGLVFPCEVQDPPAEYFSDRTSNLALYPNKKPPTVVDITPKIITQHLISCVRGPEFCIVTSCSARNLPSPANFCHGDFV